MLLAGLQEPAEAPVGPVHEIPSWLQSLHGRLDLRVRNRWTTRQSDADLFQVLHLDYGDPDADAVTGSLSVRFAEDLDGERDVGGFFAFDSIDDTYRRGSTARLYTAYLDVPRAMEGVSLRAGRQVLGQIPEALSFDGGRVLVKAVEDVEIGLFGGVPVNLFESSPDGDVTYGGWVSVSPWRNGRAQVEYLHLEDENTFGKFDDDLVGIALEQRAGVVRLRGRHSVLEGEPRETRVRARAVVPGFTAYAGATYVHERQVAVSYPIDPYAAFLLDVEPYWQLLLGGAVEFGAGLGAEGSITVRELEEDGAEKAYNREFRRVNVTPRATGWPFAEATLAFPVDYWVSSRDDFWTAGADVTLRVHDRVDLGYATSYALYVVDALTGEERERVRMHTASVRWRVETGFRLDVRLTLEENDLDTYRTLQVGATHVF